MKKEKKYKNHFRSFSHHRTIKLLNKDENEIFKNFQQNYNFSRNSALSGFALYKPPELWIIVNIQENPR